MRILALSAALAALVLASAAPVEAKGCLKGAVVGGLGGKMLGHGKAGAAAGCAVGHHRANKKS
jgi:hypothetical protein